MAKKKTTTKKEVEKVNAPITVIAEIKKVVRTEKSNAQIVIDIPSKESANIPVGRVSITIETIQKELEFGDIPEEGEEGFEEEDDE